MRKQSIMPGAAPNVAGAGAPATEDDGAQDKQLGAADDVERQIDTLRASVSPHELTDERRDDYVAELWALFSSKAVRGHVSVEDATDLAIRFPIEGASAEAIERTKPHPGPFAFEELVVLFDNISKSASEEYRDIDMEQRETQEEIELPPHKYLWSQMPCSGYPKDVQYRLEEGWRLADVKPKTTLIIITVFLMALIGTSLLVIIYELWTNSSYTREHDALITEKNTMSFLAQNFETQFYTAQFVELKDQTVILAGLSDYFVGRHVNATLARAAISAQRVGSQDAPPHVAVLAPGIVTVATQLAALGVRFDDAKLRTLMAANGFPDLFASTSTPRIAVNATNASRVCGLAVPAYNETVVETLPSEELQTIARSQNPFFVPPNTALSSTEPGHCFQAGLPEFRFTPLDVTSRTYPRDVNGSATVVVLSDDGYVDPVSCIDENGDDSCVALKTQILAGTLSGVNTPAIQSVGSIWAASPRPYGGGYIVVANEYAPYLVWRQNLLIKEAEYINWNFIRTTEIVVGRPDPNTGVFVTQSTGMRFESDCLVRPCQRIDAAQRNAIGAWTTKGPFGSITPDYRPEAVAGYATFMANTNAVLLLERDMLEIRTRSLKGLIEIINNANAAWQDADVLLFRYVGQPVTHSFDPDAGCEDGADCLSDPSLGIYFKYGCIDCMRVRRIAYNSTLEVLTTLSRPVARGLPASAVGTVLDTPYRDVLYYKTSVETYFTGYTGSRVLGVGFYVANYSIGVMIEIAADTFLNSWWWDPFVAIMISAAVLVVGLLTVSISTNLSLGSMERDWLSAKEEIEREKAHFARIVADLVPPNLSQRMLRGQRIVAETINNVAVVFSDICGFSEFTQEMSAKHIVRLVAYTFHTLQVVADDCGLLRLSSIGDTYIVYGSTPNAEIKLKPESHAAVRAARFGVLSAMVFSPLVSHWPESVKQFKEAFKDRAKSVEAFKVPRIRFGAHCGVVPSGIVQTDGAPRFDMYGLVPALAARMCATSTADRLHMTAFMKDAVSLHDPARMFLFDDPRKTIVRGQGTVTSYFTRATAHDLTNQLIENLHVKRAPLVVVFDGDKRRKRAVAHGGSVDGLEHSTTSDRQSSHKSKNSRGSK